MTKDCKIFSCIVSYRDLVGLRKAIAAQKAMKVPLGYQLDIYVIDNSEEPKIVAEVQKLAGEFSVKAITLKENKGVSGAYAHAVALVLQQAYDFLWLWDQDSLPADDCLTALLQSFQNEPTKQNQHAKLFGPDHSLPPLGIVGPKLVDVRGQDAAFVFAGPPYDLRKMRHGRFPMERIESGEVETTFLVNSGSLIHRDVLAAVGGPEVGFFMDMVDWEYTSRVVAAGFRLLMNANTRILHQVGEPNPKRFFGRTFIGRGYRPFRYYFQARNEILMARLGQLSRFDVGMIVMKVFFSGAKILIAEKKRRPKLTAYYAGWFAGLRSKSSSLSREELTKQLGRV